MFFGVEQLWAPDEVEVVLLFPAKIKGDYSGFLCRE